MYRALAIAIVLLGLPPRTSDAQNVTNYDAIPDPLLFLLREPAVQADLELNATQLSQLRELNERHDGELLASRNTADAKVQARVAEIFQQSRQFVEATFSHEQQARLAQITYRTRGIRCVLVPSAAEKLKLTDEQRKRIEQQVATAREQLQQLRDQVSEGKLAAQAAEQAAAKAIQKEQEQILAVLSPEQQQGVAGLVGPTFDLRQLGRVTFKAPEIPHSDPWINSPPLQLQKLRGKVVALHFWAFGCSNCIQNYPWYKQWYDKYQGQGLVIVGVHTPETTTEHQIPRVREQVAEADFKFPVVVDNELKIWNKWGNSMWPSVYLVDKRGRLRYWWYGELNWQGAGGQNTMAQRIEELLAEAE